MLFKFKLEIFKIIQKIFLFFNFKIYYSKDVNYFKKIKIDDIIDVGVAKGTNFLLKQFPNANYFLVEANKNYYTFIQENLTKYKFKLFKIAASNKVGEKAFFNQGPISSFYQRKNFKFKNKLNVKTSRLDLILANEKISKDSILKIDCEGGELDVLKGANNILKKVRYIIIEIRLQNIKTYNPSELIVFLYNKGFYWQQIIKVYYANSGIDFLDVIFKKK